MKATDFFLGLFIGAGVGILIGRQSKKREELSELSIKELNIKLETLVAAEEFETAAIVRDVIKAKETKDV